MENTWKTGGTVLLEKDTFRDLIVHDNSDNEGEMAVGEIWFDSANDVYKGKNSQEVIQFAIQSDVDALEGRMDTAESNITDLQGRVTIAEGEIDTLQNDMTTAQGDITDLQGRMDIAEGEVDTLQSAVSVNQSNISALFEHVSRQIFGLRVESVSSTVVSIKAGARIPINGVFYTVDSDIDVNVPTAAGETLLTTQWYWIAATVPASGTTLSASDFQAARITISWDSTRGYWTFSISGATKRVLFPVRTDDSGDLIGFSISNGFWTPYEPNLLRFVETTSPIIEAWHNVEAIVPSAANHRYLAYIQAAMTTDGLASSLWVRNGDSSVGASEDRRIFNETATNVGNSFFIATNTSRQVAYYCKPNVAYLVMSVGAFALPPAMAY